MKEKIDFIIPWVDGSDPEWRKEKLKYDKKTNVDSRDVRYRGLDNLKFWFRGVEKFAPWVNKIHFITWGHLPSWINTSHPKLNILYHEDYIPREYLPTFSTRPIELNFHRIEGLCEQFVYFNDDMFLTKPVNKSDFFKKGLPCDSAIMTPMISKFRNSTIPNVASVMEIINTIYDKNKVIKRDIFKWFNLKYGKHMISTLLMLPYSKFPGFLNQHLPNSYLKSTFEELWEEEYELLNKTCLNKFRTAKDINQQLPKYKQYVEGNFFPRNPKIGRTYNFTNDNQDIVYGLKKQKHKLVCINDNGSDLIKDFEKEKKVVIEAFETVLGEKSNYEL